MALVTLCLKLRVDCLPAAGPEEERVLRRVVGGIVMLWISLGGGLELGGWFGGVVVVG